MYLGKLGLRRESAMCENEDMKNQHAVGYVRVSTDRQDDSLELQTERIQAYCKVAGLTLDTILVDKDVSGKTRISERPQGSKIAGLVKTGAAHVVAMKLG